MSDTQENGLMNLQLEVNAQFIKDLSFENPHLLKMMRSNTEMPEIDIKINVNHTPIDAPAGVHEVTLLVQASGKKDNAEVFVLELTYGGVFTIKNVEENFLHPILMIECPRLLFPFVRHLIAEISREGGYPPLLLNPVDFADLYRQRLEQITSEAQGSA
jgi:preprotein translocase subunit SecB